MHERAATARHLQPWQQLLQQAQMHTETQPQLPAPGEELLYARTLEGAMQLVEHESSNIDNVFVLGGEAVGASLLILVDWNAASRAG